MATDNKKQRSLAKKLFVGAGIGAGAVAGAGIGAYHLGKRSLVNAAIAHLVDLQREGVEVSPAFIADTKASISNIFGSGPLRKRVMAYVPMGATAAKNSVVNAIKNLISKFRKIKK
jgi:hypothetical protein